MQIEFKNKTRNWWFSFLLSFRSDACHNFYPAAAAAVTINPSFCHILPCSALPSVRPQRPGCHAHRQAASFWRLLFHVSLALRLSLASFHREPSTKPVQKVLRSSLVFVCVRLPSFYSKPRRKLVNFTAELARVSKGEKVLFFVTLSRQKGKCDIFARLE